MITARRGNRRRALLAALALASAAAGCELDRVNVPSSEGQMVVHAIVDPSKFDYYVLVEETLTGQVELSGDFHRDTLDPIVAGGGIPVTGAEVRITSDQGASGVGRELSIGRMDGRGRGVYHFRNQLPPPLDPQSCRECVPISRAQHYTLRVTDGQRVVTGETTTPSPGPGVPQTQVREQFDRTQDTVRVEFATGGTVARYLFHISTPFGPLDLFTDSATIAVPGTISNFAAEGFPPAFVPGFRETISLSAVDINYFDYFRSFNSPFTGAGLINHLSGGTGVFGSSFFVDTKRLDVRAPYVDPLDGRYVGGTSGGDTLEIWLGERVNDGRLLSGSLRRVLPDFLGVARVGVLGAESSGTLRLDVLNAEIANDVYRRYTATVSGDILTAVASGETLTFRRLP